MKRWDARKKCPNEIVCFTPGGELLPDNVQDIVHKNNGHDIVQ